jgi:hypothetical protein
MLSGLFDMADLDVGQPQRARGATFDDAAAEPPTQLKGKVRAGPGLNQLRAPAQELRVERARPCLITGVELQMNDGPRTGRMHVHLPCDPRSGRNPSLAEQNG